MPRSAFNEFWNDDWTPKHLLKGDANVYRQITIALKPNEWRTAGLVTVLDKMHDFNGERKIINVDATTVPTANPPTTSPPTATQRKSVPRPFSVHKLARKSCECGASLAERSHRADDTESHGPPMAAQGAVPRTRRRISRMLEAPPSMRGMRKKPLKTSGGETFSQSQQLPRPVTAFCSDLTHQCQVKRLGVGEWRGEHAVARWQKNRQCAGWQHARRRQRQQPPRREPMRVGRACPCSCWDLRVFHGAVRRGGRAQIDARAYIGMPWHGLRDA
jgi:hypothetical protein